MLTATRSGYCAARAANASPALRNAVRSSDMLSTPGNRPPALAHRSSGSSGRLSCSDPVLLHLLDQALRPDICPCLLDVIKAFLARGLSEYRLPAVWYVSEDRPQRMLAFVIDQDEIASVRIFKGVWHNIALSRGT